MGKAGVIDALTKDLVRMYEEPERPQQALDFIKQYLGASVGVDHEALLLMDATMVACMARSAHLVGRISILHFIPWSAIQFPPPPIYLASTARETNHVPYSSLRPWRGLPFDAP